MGTPSAVTCNIFSSYIRRHCQFWTSGSRKGAAWSTHLVHALNIRMVSMRASSTPFTTLRTICVSRTKSIHLPEVADTTWGAYVFLRPFYSKQDILWANFCFNPPGTRGGIIIIISSINASLLQRSVLAPVLSFLYGNDLLSQNCNLIHGYVTRKEQFLLKYPVPFTKSAINL